MYDTSPQEDLIEAPVDLTAVHTNRSVEKVRQK